MEKKKAMITQNQSSLEEMEEGQRPLYGRLAASGYALSLDSLIASNISCLVTFLFKPGTSNGERRERVDRGTMAYMSPLRRFITTSSVLDSSRTLDSFSLASEYV